MSQQFIGTTGAHQWHDTAFGIITGQPRPGVTIAPLFHRQPTRLLEDRHLVREPNHCAIDQSQQGQGAMGALELTVGRVQLGGGVLQRLLGTPIGELGPAARRGDPQHLFDQTPLVQTMAIQGNHNAVQLTFGPAHRHAGVGLGAKISQQGIVWKGTTDVVRIETGAVTQCVATGGTSNLVLDLWLMLAVHHQHQGAKTCTVRDRRRYHYGVSIEDHRQPVDQVREEVVADIPRQAVG